MTILNKYAIKDYKQKKLRLQSFPAIIRRRCLVSCIDTLCQKA